MSTHKKKEQAWDQYPTFDHIDSPKAREQLERRRRHRQVRYWLFSLQNAENQGRAINDPPLLPGFVHFWLQERPAYQVKRVQSGYVKDKVEPRFDKTVWALGGFTEFAKRWDVDADLVVYIRHASVWQEWNATLMRVVPVLGEGE